MAEATAPNAYSTQVTKILERTNLPEEALANPHHIRKGKDGPIVRFKNPYPSYHPPQPLKHIIL